MLGIDPRPYISSAEASRLYQGEILSNVVERSVNWTGRTEDGDDNFGMVEVVHPYAVIATQDCDLAQDASARSTPSMENAKFLNASVPSVLLVVASEFEKTKDHFGGSDIRKRARQNKDERYQFLATLPAIDDALAHGVPALTLDFKRFFTYPTAELLRAIERKETYRRARLITPYAEHLSSRLAYFIQRIGLPRDHHDLDGQSGGAKPAS